MRLAMSQQVRAGLYIHIPFCRRRCFYCDFPIQVVGDRKSTIDEESQSYVKFLLQDIDNTLLDVLQNQPYITAVDSLYFGGGTPSLLHPRYVDMILSKVKSYLPLAFDCEVTMEVDPGTFDASYLTRLSNLGVNRLSFGIQSFQDEALRLCGRPHTVADIYHAMELVHKSEFRKNFNIDLISSLPQMTVDNWRDTLEKAIDVQSTHISVYDLQVEENTAFGRWYTPGIFPLPTEQSSADLYLQAVSTLSGAWPAQGFEHYEVSNYAKKGFRSRHNQKYWACSDVIGVGMSAASLIQGVRLTRPKIRSEYERWVGDWQRLQERRFSDMTRVGTESGIESESNLEVAESRVDVFERVMLALRTADGLNLHTIRSEYGDTIVDALIQSVLPFVESGHVRISNTNSKSLANDDSSSSVSVVASDSVTDDGLIQLTDPSGFIISNTIISSIFAALHDILD